MTADRREIGGVVLAVALLVLAGGWLGGVGFLNGDAAAYLAQAREGDLAQRTVHAGYLAVASGLAGQVADLERALDWLATGSAVLAALGAAALVRSGKGSPAAAALGTVAVLLPLAAHAEVDPTWIAAVVWARALPGPASGVAFALATWVSPVALLAAPWVAFDDRGRSRWVAVGAVVAVVGLTVLSSGDWWVGDRGVLSAPMPRPWRALQEWRHLPWVLLPLALASDQTDARELLTWVPFLLAPPDTPAWAIPAIGLAVRAAGGAVLVPGVAASLALGIQLAIGGFAAFDRSARVAHEDRVVRELVADMAPGDGLIAPFTWGARVGVRATGDPYGVRWRPPEGFLREQRPPWCDAPLRTVWTLPPVDGEPGRLPASDPAVRAGCAQSDG